MIVVGTPATIFFHNIRSLLGAKTIAKTAGRANTAESIAGIGKAAADVRNFKMREHLLFENL